MPAALESLGTTLLMAAFLVGVYLVGCLVVAAVLVPFLGVAEWMIGLKPGAPGAAVLTGAPAPAPDAAPRGITGAEGEPPADDAPRACARCGSPLVPGRMVMLLGRPFCEEHFA